MSVRIFTVDHLEDSTFTKLFKTDADDIGVTPRRMTGVRESLTKAVDAGEISDAAARAFLDDAEAIRNMEGSKEIMKDMDLFSKESVAGPMQEARIAAGTSRDIKELQVDVGEKGTVGEVDIEFEDGALAESKATDLSGMAEGDFRFRELGKQISNWDAKYELNGREVIVYAKQKPNNPSKVANALEADIKDKTGSRPDIHFSAVSEVS